MARIYIARTTGIGSFERHVVLKVILPERAQDENSVNMFLDEARLAASLNHQNVAQVFEVGKEVGIHFLAMEYVHGQDLRALLSKAGGVGARVPLELALTVVSGAAAGLDHAHERRNSDGTPMGIVHRDVSPSNIMIGYDGAVKLLDFGIAKARTRSAETQSGIIKGKFAYMAPEQCRGREVDRRSDVFSLGIILYEVTTQHRCFRADSDFDTMHRIVTGDIVRPSRLVSGYPPALEAIVMKALSIEANQRYQSAGLLLEAIESFAQGAQMALSTMSLGRFMREMFGDIPEPWLVIGDIDPAAAGKEQTISNTDPSGKQAHPRPPSSPPAPAAPVAPPVAQRPAAAPSRPSAASLSSQAIPRAAASPGSASHAIPRAASSAASQGIPRTASAASQGIPRAASAAPQGIPRAAVSASSSQGIPRAAVSASSSQGIPRAAVSASSSQGIPRAAVSASSSQGIPRAVTSPGSSAHVIPRAALPSKRLSAPALPVQRVSQPVIAQAPPHEPPLHLPSEVAIDLPGDATVAAPPPTMSAPHELSAAAEFAITAAATPPPPGYGGTLTPPSGGYTTPIASPIPDHANLTAAGPPSHAAGPPSHAAARPSQAAARPSQAGAPPSQAAARPSHPAAPPSQAGAPPSHAGAPPSHAGAPPSHAGGPPSHAGGPPSHAGGPPSHAGGPPSHTGAPPSHAGGPPSHAGGPPSHAAGPLAHPGYPMAPPGYGGAAALGPGYAGMPPTSDGRMMAPRLPPLPPSSPSAVAMAVAPLGDASRGDAGPVAGGAPLGTQPITSLRGGYLNGPALSRGDLYPGFELDSASGSLSLRPSNRHLYIGLGVVLIGIIVLLVILILEGPSESAAATPGAKGASSGLLATGGDGAQGVPAYGDGAHGGPANGDGAHGGPANGDGAHGGPAHGDGAHGVPANGNGARGVPAHGDGAHGGPANGIGAHGVPAHGDGAQGGPANGDGAHGEPGHGGPAHGDGAHGEPAHGDGAHGVPGHGGPAHGDGAHGEPAHGDGAQVVAIAAAGGGTLARSDATAANAKGTAAKADAAAAHPAGGGASEAARRASIRVRVVSNPPGAEVSLAGRSLGTTPLDIATERRSGSDVLTIHRARYQDVVTRIDLGRDLDQTVTLAPLPAPAAVRATTAERDGRPATRDRSGPREARPRVAAPARDDCQPPDRLNPFETCRGHACKPCPTATP